MTPQRILELCDEVLLIGLSRVQLVLPNGLSSVIKGFGRSELCCVTQDGRRVFWYKAQKVKDAVLKLIKEQNENLPK